jgi:prepilin peptidase CpaA
MDFAFGVAALDAASLVVISVAAAWIDVRQSRIPNRLTVSGFVIALLLRIALGWPALAAGMLGAVIAAGVSLPLFLVGGLGGGDVKLLMVVGAFLGPQRLVTALVVTAVAGLLMGLSEAVRRGVILPVLWGCRDLFVYMITFGRSGSKPEFTSPGVVKIPYGVAIALGAVIGRFV